MACGRQKFRAVQFSFKLFKNYKPVIYSDGYKNQFNI